MMRTFHMRCLLRINDMKLSFISCLRGRPWNNYKIGYLKKLKVNILLNN